ncbi:MAG: hypothetical protein ACPL28_08915, partial [bacterium]
MQPISTEIVEKTFKEMSLFGPEEIKMLVNKMGEEQPYVLTYLLATGDREFDESEKELFIYLGIGICQMMSTEYAPLPQISPVLLDEIEEDNLELLDSLEGLDEEEFIASIEKVLENYCQYVILFYVLDTLIEGETE